MSVEQAHATPPAAAAAPRRLPARARLAIGAGRLAAAASRVAGRGSGAVIGGRLSLRLDPHLMARLAAPLQVALVSGTNGKTTTTRLVAEALRAGGGVASNALGANMPAGITAALAAAGAGQRYAAIEVDEKYLATVATHTRPRVIALLNLSRDQLDRAAETRMLAQRWREGLAETTATLVANADDPLVVWAASAGPPVVWMAAGQTWQDDAWSCPACGGVITRRDTHWSCGSCPLQRPTPTWWLDGQDVIDPRGDRHPLSLRLPGRANRANALTAAAVADVLGVATTDALPRLAHVEAVAGRYVTVDYRGRQLRLLLAKNPAGWLETFHLLASETATDPPDPSSPAPPVLLAVNALSADGTDTSWLWDVDYTRLKDRRVLVIGQRRLDLAVRLHVAGVEFTVHDNAAAAVDAAPAGRVDVIANYTAFQQLRRTVGA